MTTDVLVGSGPTLLTKKWYVDGTQSDVGTVTYTVVDANGVSVTSGTATKSGSGATTIYTFSLAIQTAVRSLTVTWTRSDTTAFQTDQIEIVRSQLFTESQARKFGQKDNMTGPLSLEAEYPDAVIADERWRIGELLESWTGISWIPRYRRFVMSGNGGYVLSVPDREVRTLIAATVGGSAVNVANVEVDPEGLLWRTDGIWTYPTVGNVRNVVVEYEYGMPQIVDGVDRIALIMLKDRLTPTDISDRALSATSEFGTVALAQPGGPHDNRTGWPEVNMWLKTHDRRMLIA